MRVFPNFRFRTRLALIVFLTMACTSAILIWTYVYQIRRMRIYVTGITSDLLAISQLTQQKIPPKADRNQVYLAYKKALEDAGLTIDVASPAGDIVVSSNPRQVGKKINPKKRRAEKQEPINIEAEFKDINIDPGVEQHSYVVEFPIVQGEKVIGYVRARGVGDEVVQLMRRTYLTRFFWIVATMLAGLIAVVYLAFRFTKPVDMLVTGANQVAQGNLYVSLPTTGTDEMGRLAETFNQMVERLRENRKLQERFNEVEKMSLLGRFAGTVAHEVRNSLNFINLSIDQVRAKYAGADERTRREVERNLANAKEEVSRLNRLVNDFLAAGRQSPPAFAPCDVRATLQEAITVVEKQAHAQDIEITEDLPAELPVLRADPAQIKTCFLNILTNAVQAMPRGGRIRVTAETVSGNGTAGRLVLRFADTGPGIPRQDREKIFAPYFSTKATGFGLGLAITKKIVEDHGGRIYVTDSQAPGTVMVVELPLPGGWADAGQGPAPRLATRA